MNYYGMPPFGLYSPEYTHGFEQRHHHENGHNHEEQQHNGIANGHTYAGARNAETTQAYLVGGGIASLAAAVHLIQDAHVPGSQIHIIESLPLPGGALDAAGNAKDGYIFRGGRMLNFSYLCLYELLSKVPSLQQQDPQGKQKTVMQEIDEFNANPANKTRANARVVTRGLNSAKIEDVSDFELSATDKADLVKVMMEGEFLLGKKRIDQCFGDKFFASNFWYMWATMFAFQPWHSAVEFRRYLHRFFHEFPRIDTLAGVVRTPYNQYDSIVMPITKYLEGQGVHFRYNTTVTKLAYAPRELTTVSCIDILEGTRAEVISVRQNDIVIITLGSMTASSSLGSNTYTPAVILPPVSDAEDPSWALWRTLSKDHPNFGNPFNFSNRINESSWESFTVTLKDRDLLSRIENFTHNAPGTGALMTFKNSHWLMSIVVPHQPHFLNQPEGVYVLWGYGLLPQSPGNFVPKPMAQCTGREILQELLGHLDCSPEQPILDHAITIPCMMPYITSQFLTRDPKKDRPKVIPDGCTNLAFVGQFVEIPEDVVFTVEYSVRGAQMAVYQLMGLKKNPPKVFRGEHNLKMVAETVKTFFHGGIARE